MSSFPPSEQNPYVTPQMVEKTGMSGSTKFLLVLGVIFLILIILCCGGLALTTFMATAYVKNAVSEDPAVINQRRSEMLEIEIPESLEPRGSFDATVPMTDKRLMTVVVYSDQSPGEQKAGNSMVLVGIGDALMQMSDEQMKQEIDRSLRQQGLGQSRPGDNWESKEKEFTIGGEARTFVYRTRKGESGEAQQIEATGTVAGKRGPVMVIISVDAETWDEEDVDRIFESIE